MSVRSINTQLPCARTVARLDEAAITVARTGDKILLLNIPRNIDELGKATRRPRGLLARMRERF